MTLNEMLCSGGLPMFIVMLPNCCNNQWLNEMLCSGGLPMFIVMLPNCVRTNDSEWNAMFRWFAYVYSYVT